MNADQARVEALPPHVQLIQMGTAFWTSRVLYAAAKLSLPDHLATGSKSAAELAPLTGTHAASLHRLMRTLASLGVLSEDSDHSFTLTPLGEALKTGAPGAARATVLALAGDWAWRVWDSLLYSLETGLPAFEKVWGMSPFDYATKNPEAASYFNEAMIGFHGSEPPAVASAYDFSAFNTIVDVGGGTGNLLATILSRHVGPRGILADLPHVVREACSVIEARGLAHRITTEAIDFFKSVPGW